MESLKPFRERIDTIDEKIVALLVERFGIVHEVAAIKARENIPVVQGARAQEVKDRVSAMAQAQGLDGRLLYAIYTLIIDHAHVLEHSHVDSHAKDGKGEGQ